MTIWHLKHSKTLGICQLNSISCQIWWFIAVFGYFLRHSYQVWPNWAKIRNLWLIWYLLDVSNQSLCQLNLFLVKFGDFIYILTIFRTIVTSYGLFDPKFEIDNGLTHQIISYVNRTLIFIKFGDSWQFLAIFDATSTKYGLFGPKLKFYNWFWTKYYLDC